MKVSYFPAAVLQAFQHIIFVEIKRKTQLQRDTEALEALLEKGREYAEHMENLGERNSYSRTDHSATFMRMKDDHMFRINYRSDITTSHVIKYYPACLAMKKGCCTFFLVQQPLSVNGSMLAYSITACTVKGKPGRRYHGSSVVRRRLILPLPSSSGGIRRKSRGDFC